ncbi:Hypothetical protein J6898_04341 [Nakaseomyces glabratus]
MKQTTTTPSASLTQVRITVPLPCYCHWRLEGYQVGISLPTYCTLCHPQGEVLPDAQQNASSTKDKPQPDNMPKDHGMSGCCRRCTGVDLKSTSHKK